jgi:uncharacterized repeat protein (TIGR01451 family)
MWTSPGSFGYRLTPGLLLALTMALPHAFAAEAGRAITSIARADFSIDGVAQPPVITTITIVVDELLDAVMVADDADAVPAHSPQSTVVLSFTVTNTGNGTERFRLVPETGLAGADFEPQSIAVWLEDNGEAGLQTGPGGDRPYSAGDDDPRLGPGESLAAYLVVHVPAGVPAGAETRVGLRAVAETIYQAAGTDDPRDSAFPAPGASWAGLGDAGEAGEPVTAVVGAAHAAGALRIRDEARVRVTAPLVAMHKDVVGHADPSGGTGLAAGTVVDYRITASAAATAAPVHALVITDQLPPDLEFLPGTLQVSGAIPAGAPAHHFDAATRRLVVPIGTLEGGQWVVVDYQARIRALPHTDNGAEEG